MTGRGHRRSLLEERGDGRFVDDDVALDLAVAAQREAGTVVDGELDAARIAHGQDNLALGLETLGLSLGEESREGRRPVHVDLDPAVLARGERQREGARDGRAGGGR
jgi:hypothetical protein